MNIKNYTSEIPAQTSISKIAGCLIAANATHISQSYKDGKCDGMYFQIPVNDIPLTFRLPVKIEACEKYLLSQRTKLTSEARQRIHEQSERTAWKLLYEWIQIQVSMIQMEQAEAIEVFLPYMFNGKTNQTLFQQYKECGFKQLTAGQ